MRSASLLASSRGVHNQLSVLVSCMAWQLLRSLLKRGVCLVHSVIGHFQDAAAAEVRHEPMPLLLQDPDSMVLLAAMSMHASNVAVCGKLLDSVTDKTEPTFCTWRPETAYHTGPDQSQQPQAEGFDCLPYNTASA